jgi:CYTH domain-containing protein
MFTHQTTKTNTHYWCCVHQRSHTQPLNTSPLLMSFVPESIKDCKFKEMIDIYIPKMISHAPIRIRKNGDKYEITKKQPLKEGDSSQLIEQTINLLKEEFDALEKEIVGRRVYKKRYLYDYKGNVAEIDVFQNSLKGLVLIDFEFENENKKNSFEMPEFCLVDVTQEEFIAGGILCGKNYSELEKKLTSFGYKKIDTNFC